MVLLWDIISIYLYIISVAKSRMIGIKFSVSQYTLYIISVYLPSCSGCTDVCKESLDN